MNWTPTDTDEARWGPNSPAIAGWGKQDVIFERMYNLPSEQKTKRLEEDGATKKITKKTKKHLFVSNRVDCWQNAPTKIQTQQQLTIIPSKGKADPVKKNKSKGYPSTPLVSMASPSSRLFKIVRETPRTRRGERKLLPKRKVMVSKMSLDLSNNKSKGTCNPKISTARTSKSKADKRKKEERRPHSAR
jgi:hypothetical protein